MKIYCLVCNNDFEADVFTTCPHCGAVGDDLEEIPDPDFSAEHYLIRACKECGLEDKHTIAIGKIVDAKKGGYLDTEYADFIARTIYLHSDEALQYPFTDEEEDAYFDECDESGFDPYMGCYTGDC